ncbi:MAG: tetratricopeptide repeat protein [Pirellulales bacterium]|nr:tetratricopeptide repeat protein [Pirellulales bacterium]
MLSQVFKYSAIFLLSLCCSLPAMRGELFWDDVPLIRENPVLRDTAGLANIWLGRETVDYFPLTYTVWWVCYQIWGDWPIGYHLFNGLLYAFACCLIYRGLVCWKGTQPWFFAAYFAAHPLNVASVAWISEGKNCVALVLYISALNQLARATGTSGQARWWWAGVLAALAMLAKPSAVMLPVVGWLLCAWNGLGRDRRVLIWTGGLTAFALVVAWLTIRTQADENFALITSGPVERGQRVGWIAWWYLGRMLVPFYQPLLEERWALDSTDPVNWLPLAAWLGLVIALSFFWRSNAWSRALLLSLTLMLVSLFPVLGLFDMRFQQYAHVADHLGQLGLVGLVIGLSVGSKAILNSVTAKLPRLLWAELFFKGLQAFALVILASTSWHRAGLYATEERFWSAAVAQNPLQGLAHFHLGTLYERQKNYALAADHFELALQLEPLYPPAALRWGVMLYRTGKLTAARRELQKYTAHTPEAEAYYLLGEIAAQERDWPTAIQNYQSSAKLKSDNAGVYFSWAIAEREQQSWQQARDLLQKSLEMEKNGLTYFELAEVYKRTGRYAESLKYYEQALILLPEHQAALNNFAWLLCTLRDPALRDPARAVQLAQRGVAASQGRDPNILDTLATAHAAAGDWNSALATWARAIALCEGPELAPLRMELEAKQREWSQQKRE